MTDKPGDRERWAQLCNAENAFYQARMSLLAGVRADDLVGIVASALVVPAQRGTALRLLLVLPEEQSRPHLAALARFAAVGHPDVELVRGVIERMDRSWVTASIDGHVVRALGDAEQCGEPEEAFRRIAELYLRLGEPLLAVHLGRCSAHAALEIRELAEEFGPRAANGRS